MENFEKKVVYSMLSLFAVGCLGMGVFIFNNEDALIKKHAETVESTTADFDKQIKAIEKTIEKSRFDYLQKSYELQLSMDKKINNLLISRKEDSIKLDMLTEAFTAEKKYTADRFAKVNSRFETVEKTVAAIAKAKNFSILSWKYGYEDK